MKWNEVIYADCMNEENGLPTLEDKSIDLCLTDPPYGVNYKDDLHIESIQYEDEFIGFKWLEEILRVCKGIIFTPGSVYLYDYITFKKPPYLLRFAYYYDSYRRIHYDVLLAYGSVPKITSIKSVVKVKRHHFDGYIHPSPKSEDLWRYILRKLKPKSVIDPFIGSGTTAEACTKLGIPWVGYEINEVYSQDINKRLKGCVREPQQIELNNWLEAERE